MKSGLMKFICRILIVSLAMLPLQTVQAGMIGTEQVVTAAQAQAARAAVNGFVSRTDVSAQLQTLGLSAQNAKDRVAALTDIEVTKLASQIDSLPAGAGGELLLLIALILIIVFVGSGIYNQK